VDLAVRFYVQKVSREEAPLLHLFGPVYAWPASGRKFETSYPLTAMV